MVPIVVAPSSYGSVTSRKAQRPDLKWLGIVASGEWLGIVASGEWLGIVASGQWLGIVASGQ